MLVASFTDLHVHPYKNFDNKGSRLENCLKVLDDMFKFCHKNGIKHLLFEGDLADQQQAIPTIAGNALMFRLDKLFTEYPDILFIAISGNHDHCTKSIYGKSGISYLTQLAIAFPDRFSLIDDAVHSIKSDCDVYGIPYYSHPEEYDKALQSMYDLAMLEEHQGIKKILMIHQTPTNKNPNIPIDTDVNDERYKAFDLVLCGHIHQKEKITDKFYLLGTPLHRDLGDAGDEKGFWVFDTNEPAESMTFMSRKGRYPEFIRVVGVGTEGLENDFIIHEPDVSGMTETQEEELSNFKASLDASELLENFYNKIHGKDKDLLKVGLEFIQ